MKTGALNKRARELGVDADAMDDDATWTASSRRTTDDDDAASMRRSSSHGDGLDDASMRRYRPSEGFSETEETAGGMNEEWLTHARVRARVGTRWHPVDAIGTAALTMVWAVGPTMLAMRGLRVMTSGRTKDARRFKRRAALAAYVLSEVAWYASRRAVKQRYDADDNMTADPTRVDFDRFLQLRHDAVRDFKSFLYGWTKSWTNTWAGVSPSFYDKPESTTTSPSNSRASTPGLEVPRASTPCHRDHAKDFLRFGFHDALSAEEIGEQKERELDLFIEEIEARWNVKFDDGVEKESFDFMFHTKEKLGALHQPLIFTAWVNGIAGVAGLALRSLGFRAYRGDSGCWYWANCDVVMEDWKQNPSRTLTKKTRYGRGRETREVLCGDIADETSSSDDAKPIIFVHGLGVGLAPYLPSIVHLLKSKPGRKIACVTLPHISMRASKTVPELDQMVSTVMEITKKHALRSPALYGHSFGSFVVARACQMYFVSSVVLVDPVAVCLFLPQTVGILYQLSKSWTEFKSRASEGGLKVLADAQFWREGRWLIYFFLRDYFLLREIGVTTALRRKFWWARYNMWAEDLPPDSLIVLESNDLLIDAEAIARHVLRQSHARIIYQEGFSHGEAYFPWGYGLRADIAEFFDGLPNVSHSAV